MADFIIPKGKEFKFNVKVIAKDSFLPQDLALMDNATSSFELMVSATQVLVPGTISVTKVADAGSDPITYVNGNCLVTIPDTVTSTLLVDRGDRVDGYYLKPLYQGILNIKFSNGGPSDMIAIIDNIYVAPTGN